MIFQGLLAELSEFQDYKSSGAPDGRTPQIIAGGIRMPMRVDVEQQSCFLRRNIGKHYGPVYASEVIRVPEGYDWSDWEHKLLILHPDVDGMGVSFPGRVLVNLRGGGLSPTVQVHIEKLEQLGDGISEFTSARWPADGLPHQLEVYLERTGGVYDRMVIWLDGQIILDKRGRTCAPQPAAITGADFGAYANKGPRRAPNGAYIDILRPAIISDRREIGILPLPVPPVTPVPTPATYETLATRAQDLARRSQDAYNDLTAMAAQILALATDPQPPSSFTIDRIVANIADLRQRALSNVVDLGTLATDAVALSERLTVVASNARDLAERDDWIARGLATLSDAVRALAPRP